jgi:hypothetical protein
MLEYDGRASLGLKELYLLQQHVGKPLGLACFLGAIAGMLPHSRVA